MTEQQQVNDSNNEELLSGLQYPPTAEELVRLLAAQYLERGGVDLCCHQE